MIDLASEFVTRLESPVRPRLRCELHGVRILDSLPERCPLQASDVCNEITNERTAAFGLLRDDDRRSEGLQRLDAAEACSKCLSSGILASETIRRLRAASEATTTAQARRQIEMKRTTTTTTRKLKGRTI